jgi:hypothetical protein
VSLARIADPQAEISPLPAAIEFRSGTELVDEPLGALDPAPGDSRWATERDDDGD